MQVLFHSFDLATRSCQILQTHIASFCGLTQQGNPVPLHSTVSNRLRQALPGVVRAEAFAKSHQPASRASGPFRNFRTHHAPDFSLSLSQKTLPFRLLAHLLWL
jgi:hypothetical protein